MNESFCLLILALVAVAFAVRWIYQRAIEKLYRTPDDTPNYLGGRKGSIYE